MKRKFLVGLVLVPLLFFNVSCSAVYDVPEPEELSDPV